MQTGRDTVIVDTAGRLHIDDELMTELTQLRDAFNPPRSCSSPTR
jgi:signal recognition particle subunit SRP54